MPTPVKPKKPLQYKVVLRNKMSRATRQITVAGFNEGQARLAALPNIKEVIISCDRIGGLEGFIRGDVFAQNPGVRDMLLFFKDLATLLKMGTTVVKALRLEIGVADNKLLRASIAQLITSIEEGKSLSTSLKLQPEIYTLPVCALIEAGEKSGDMATVLKNMAKAMERQYKIFRKLRQAMIYPVLVLGMIVVVTYIFTFFLVPSLARIYMEFHADLPFVSRALIAISNLVKDYPVLAPIPALIPIIIITYWKRIYARPIMQKICVRMPYIGKVIRKAAITKALRTMAMLSTAKVDIRENLRLCALTAGHVEYSQAFKDIAQCVENGETLHEGFAKVAEKFGKDGPQIAAFIQSGQEAGTIPETLESVADVYEDDLDEMANNINTIIEPLIFAVMGLVVGTLLYGVYSPIFNLSFVILGKESSHGTHGGVMGH